MKTSTAKKLNELCLTAPSMIWLILWFVIPEEPARKFNPFRKKS